MTQIASLSSVALALADVAEKFSRAAVELSAKEEGDCLTAEEAAQYAKFETVNAFRKAARKEGVPVHYFSERHPLYSRKELYEWLMSR
jgi:hypothetical protein